MTLPAPYYEDTRNGIVLYCGDCLEILPHLTGIDAVVTDPPYGINYCHGARKGGVRLGTDCQSIAGDDTPFDPSPLLSWPCVIWGAEHFKERLPRGGRWLVWDKRRDGVTRDQADVENAWCSNPGVARIYRLVWDGADKAQERGQRRHHSNQKPVALMTWCLEFVQGSVCDPYCGSGTTLVACLRTGRRGIGIELDPHYCEIAAQRLKREAERYALIEPKEEKKQLGLLQ